MSAAGDACLDAGVPCAVIMMLATLLLTDLAEPRNVRNLPISSVCFPERLILGEFGPQLAFSRI
jgi:hypothetical protein